MVKLEKMQIYGFKSFSDRTEVRFPEGITAVVGPNGCGKSNIGDAINWVLGEQSPKMLRGSSMQDVIFNGSEGRKPVGLAEVSLHLSGVNGTPDGELRDVTVTRRLFRDGESEYLVNGSRARLKDIQDLLREAHVGAKTYATIEQGRIDQILNAKPKERRLILEDAAGVSGFKQKRRLAELKLEATQANLLRVQDVVAEVKRQINSLKRQAAKARRYARLRDELRLKERIRFGSRALRLDAALERLRAEEAGARDAEASTAARLASQEAELEREREVLDEAERTARLAAEAAHGLQTEIDREEARVQGCRERIQEAAGAAQKLELEAAAAQERRAAVEHAVGAHHQAVEMGRAHLVVCEQGLQARQEEHDKALRALDEMRQGAELLRRGLLEAVHASADGRSHGRALEEALERCRNQLRRLAEEGATAQGDVVRMASEGEALEHEVEACRRSVAALEEGLAGTDRALRSARTAHAEGVSELGFAREREHSAAARLRTLEDVSTRFAGLSEGVRLLLTQGPALGVHARGVIADYVQAAREVEGAADLYLEGLLPAVVLDSDDDVRKAAALLRAQGAERTLILSQTQPSGAPVDGTNGRATLPEALSSDGRVLGRLRDRLVLEPSVDGLVRERIGDAVLVDSLESALALHRDHPHLDYLTPEGDVVYASGLVAAGGRGASDHGLLAHNRWTQEARAELAEARSRAALLQVSAAARAADVVRLDEEAEQGRAAVEEARRGMLELEMRAQRSKDEHGRIDRRVRVLSGEVAMHEEERIRLEAELATASRQLEDIEARHDAAEASLRQRSERLEADEAALRALAEEVATLRADLSGRRQAESAAEREGDRLREELAEILVRQERIRHDLASARGRAQEATDLLGATERDLVLHLEKRQLTTASFAVQEQDRTERRRLQVEREGALRGLRVTHETARDSVREAELGRIRAEADRAHLDDLCLQELGVPAPEAAAQAGDGLEGCDLTALEQEIAQVRSQIEQIGPVNMMAIDEFTALEERDRFLTAQREDLQQAMESLRETIRRINRSSRQRFAEAFESIRRSYQEIFKTLFHGGRADLALEEGEDVLECGIEILAQPPGKRLGNVSLLSGGEKAMAAIALLFAIFRYQPSPFCLLDEVDAALDDVNVGRFTRMLREYASLTQFILITHNKRSMESANVLYGVTMEEPGVSKLVSLQLQ